MFWASKGNRKVTQKVAGSQKEILHILLFHVNTCRAIFKMCPNSTAGHKYILQLQHFVSQVDHYLQFNGNRNFVLYILIKNVLPIIYRWELKFLSCLAQCSIAIYTTILVSAMYLLPISYPVVYMIF